MSYLSFYPLKSITISKNSRGSYILKPDNFNQPLYPYVGQKPPPPLFGPKSNNPEDDIPYWIYSR